MDGRRQKRFKEALQRLYSPIVNVYYDEKISWNIKIDYISNCI